MFQRAFRPGCGAGNQIDFDAGYFTQAKNGGDGVFLSAADNKPRDDVRDFQIVEEILRFNGSAIQRFNEFNRSATVLASSVFVLALAR